MPATGAAPEPDLLTIDEVARRTSRSRRTVEGWLSSGVLVSVRVGGARLIPMAAYEAWLRSLPEAS
jgi:excisionase family DNA binding protein